MQVLTRKCLIVAVDTLIPGSLNEPLGFVLLLFICGGSLSLHFTFTPYRDEQLNRMESAALLTNGITLLMADYVTGAKRSDDEKASAARHTTLTHSCCYVY